MAQRSNTEEWLRFKTWTTMRVPPRPGSKLRTAISSSESSDSDFEFIAKSAGMAWKSEGSTLGGRAGVTVRRSVPPLARANSKTPSEADSGSVVSPSQPGSFSLSRA